MAKQKLIILVNLKVKYMVKDFKNRVCTHTYVGRENLSFFFFSSEMYIFNHCQVH